MMTRRLPPLLLAAALLVPAGRAAAQAKAEPPVGKHWLYVGSGQGIYRSSFDDKTGRMGTKADLAAEVPGLSAMLMSIGNKFRPTTIYAAGADEAGLEGKLYAFSVDAVTGKLAKLGDQPTGGRPPCQVAGEPKGGSYFLTVGHADGTAAVFFTDDQGELRPRTTVLSPNGFDPDKPAPPQLKGVAQGSGFHAYAPDPAFDRVVVYTIVKNNLGNWADSAHLLAPPGSRPGLLAYADKAARSGPGGGFLYAIGQADSTLSLFDLTPDAPKKPLQTVSTLPAGVKPKPGGPVALAAHPKGVAVYAINGGHNSLAAFRAVPATGLLVPAGHVALSEKGTPSGLAFDPSGNWLLVADPASNSVTSYQTATESGKPKPSGFKLTVPRPTCAGVCPRQ